MTGLISPQTAILFFLPAMVANLMLYLTARIYGSGLLVPLDLGAQLAGRRLVGDGRGLTSLPRALAAGLLCGALQGRLEEAFLLALGAQFGMVANSVVKRRRGIAQGSSHRPWDHLDFVLGASLVYWLVYPISPFMVLAGVLYCGFCHALLGGLIRAVLDRP